AQHGPAGEDADPAAEGSGEPDGPGSAPTAPEPAGAPPALLGADPDWHKAPVEDTGVQEPTRPPPQSTITLGLGAQVFGVQGKAMSGVVLRFGDAWFWVDLEFSPLWLTTQSPDWDGSFLGNHWGVAVSLAPLRTRRFELLGGFGLDVYHLWGIHGDIASLALALKLMAHFRATEQASVFASVRGYPLSSDDLELGVNRQGERGILLLGALGVEWRFQ